MKRAAHLGIDDPLLRVLAWLLGCGTVSLIGAAFGVFAMMLVLVAIAAFLCSEAS